MNIFVAKLASSVDSDNLRSLFEQYGEVDSAKVVFDRETGNSRGFGFVEMTDEQEGAQAIEALDGSNYEGRRIVVKKAEPRENYRNNTNSGNRRPPRRDGGGYNDRNNDRKRF